MLRGEQIAAAGLTDWRKLAQGLHARFLVDDLGAAAQFLAGVAALGEDVGAHLRATLGPGHVDCKLSSADAVFRDDEGGAHVVEWVTQRDVQLATDVSAVAAEQGLAPAPAAVSVVELGLDTGDAAGIAPVWAQLLTGDPAARGRGTPGDEVRDATGRSPNLWFGGGDDAGQRFHVEVYVPPEVLDERVAAVVAAGGTVVDDSNAPWLTVVADRDGNRGVLCTDPTVTTD